MDSTAGPPPEDDPPDGTEVESSTDGPVDPDVDLTAPKYYLNRELSELEFQYRVLHQALDERTPLLDRVRFLAFFTKNTDEFYMKRVGGLKQQIDADVTERTPDGRTPKEQWKEAHEKARPMYREQTECWEGTIRPALADAGVHVHDYEALDPVNRDRLREYFEGSILPTLTPLSFDPAHPFPFISNLSLSLGVLTRRPGDDDADMTFTRVKIPQNRPRLVAVETDDDDDHYVLIEDLIEANLDLLLPNVEIVDVSLFRLTRNAEVRRNEEVAEDLIDMIEEVLEQRRFATVVRLEVEEGTPDRTLDILKRQLDLTEREVYYRSGPMDFEDFFELTALDRPELKLPAWTPHPHPRLAQEVEGYPEPSRYEAHGGSAATVFDRIQRGDILLHHPYHSFTGTVQRFLEEAASDPDVLAVKAAIYRTASDSKVIESLIDAADNGKQVAVMVELKARFDEQNNLEWVRKLEENGIHVAYGTIGLKTHTKTALVVREEDQGVQLYSHIGTGNYHSETAKGYVDLGLLTADRDIGQDLVKVFNFFTGPSIDERFRKLLIAPVTMRERFTQAIRREADHARAGRDTRIVVKVNGLEDPAIVEELYRASIAGVEIDLVVRDICRLRPGLEGVSETIRVHSIVGRFLEHSRIFYFENAGDPEWYIGSADWMTRNLDNRVEAVTPVEDPACREQLRFVLETNLADNRTRWTMHPDGSYTQVRPGEDEPVVDLQETLMRQVEAAMRDPDVDRGMVGRRPDGGPELLVEPREDREHGDADQGGDETGTATSDADGERANDGPEAGVDGPDALPAPFDRYGDRWYEPDSDEYAYAVRTPAGDRRYYRTVSGAANALERYYG